MTRNRFIKNTFFLILGGMITKILGFTIKILYTRYLKSDGVSLITLVFPTYALLLTISTFALPLAITKLIAEKKERKSKIIFSSFWITGIINIVLTIIVLLFSNYYAANILHEPRCAFLIKILCFTLPFVTTTSIIKAYFFGIENIKPVIFSNISEEIIKLLMVIIFLPKFMNKGTIYGVTFYLTINFICEIMSFITLSLFMPRKIKIKNLSYKYDQKCISEISKITVPTLGSKLIGSIGYFLEPIILTNLLVIKGIDANYIRLNYGYYQAYAIAILTIPSFFLSALSSNIIPLISKIKITHNYKKIKSLTKRIITVVLICGIFYSGILYIFGKKIMYLLYKNTSGYKYLKMLLPFFIFFYLESPILSILQSLDKEKNILKITTLGIIIKYFILTFLIMLGFGFKSLIISEIINIIFVILLCIYYLNNSLFYPSQQ